MRGIATVLLFLVSAALVPVAGTAWAETGAGVVITSEPPGAIVELSGDHVLRGVTPWRLDRGLEGIYDINAFKFGYADWHGRTVLSATSRDSIFVRLTRRTPVAAALRSTIAPGWGQFYSEQNVKGTVFVAVEALVLGAALWADAESNREESDYLKAKRAYEDATEVDEMERAYEVMLREFDEYEDKHLLRRRFICAAAAVWVANIADAFFLFPEPGGGAYAEEPGLSRPGLYATLEPDGATFGLAVHF